jgi:GSCFA family
MPDSTHPYANLPPEAYWRSAVAETGLYGMKGLWKSRWVLPSDARFSTFGSCFAQHISRALVARDIGWINAEPAPGRCPAELARKYNYGVFSARTANIYTAAQLLYLVQIATGEIAADAAEFWEEGGRVYDSLRPAIEPEGFASRDEALLSRRSMIRAFRRSIAEADVFVFTLGLTEGWENAATGQPYPMCPGTVASQFDTAVHVFRNYRVAEILGDLGRALEAMRRLNPGLKLLLTVSPVPLTATASGQHVLVATTYSKSALRAVAGELVAADPAADYFPSYEIISGAPARAGFFAPNMRSVETAGVELVMKHFFAGLDRSGPAAHEGAAEGDAAHEEAAESLMAAEDLACEESLLEGFNRG